MVRSETLIFSHGMFQSLVSAQKNRLNFNLARLVILSHFEKCSGNPSLKQ